MQVSSNAAATLPSSSAAAVVLQPALGQLFSPTLSTSSARHEQLVAQREDRRRRRADNYQDALAAHMTAPRPSDVALQDEQQMAPGSAAARRAETQAQSGDSAKGRAGFKQALADATQRPAADAQPTARPAADAQPDSAAAKPTEAAAADNQKPKTADVKPAAPQPDAAPPAPASTTTAAAASTNQAAATSAAAQSTARPATAPVAMTTAATATASVRAVTSVAAAAATTTATDAAPRTSAAAVAAPVSPTAAARTTGKAGQRTALTETEPRNDDANVQRIVRLVQTKIGKDRAVANLRLDPPELGTLRLHMDLRQDQLALQVEAATPAARRVLENNLDSLRRNLEAAGIHVERIEVRSAAPVDQPDSGQSPQPQMNFTSTSQDGGRGQDASSAGRGATGGTESPSGPVPGAGAAPRAEDDRTTARREPAAESLVDVIS